MSAITNFWSKISPYFFSSNEEKDTTVEQLNFAPIPHNKKSVLSKLKRYYQYRVELEMGNWRIAVALAEDMIRPRRYDLYNIYHRAMEDDHLLSQVRTARFTVQMGDFSIMVDKKENEDLTDLLNRPWFDEYVQHNVDAELFGHSLVEFTPKQGAEFESVFLVPREHVRPETGEIVLDIHAEEGIPYRKGLIGKYLVEIGTPYDLGLLKVASRSITRKEYALGDWSRRNERYGMPFLAIKTMSRNEEEINAKADMAQNLGVNGWAILDDQDELEFHESNQAFAYQTYKHYAEKIDEYISKLINGQTGTTEEKSFVGSAQVHERILNTYTKARMRKIQYHINYCLLPFLRKHGYPIPEGATFEYHDLRKDDNSNPDNMDKGTEQQGGNDDPNPPPPSGGNKHPVKKKINPSLSFASDVQLLYKDLHDNCCTSNSEHLNFDIDLDGLVNKSIRRVFQKKVQRGDIDADAWQTNVKAIWQGIDEGTAHIDTNYENRTAYELTSQLKRNVAVFASFKNHHHVADLVDALTDKQGNIRSWAEYKPIAQSISKNYFENWLQAEYQTAIGTGQMASKWQDLVENADILPMLQYVTQRDGRVRNSHKALDGVTLPIDDPFWETYYPPNGWRCRCDVIQVAGPEKKPDLFPREDQVPPIFRHNAGKTLEVFPQSHPYYKGMNNKQRQNLIQGTARLMYDNYDSNWRKILHNKTGGYVVRHKTANTDKLKINGSIAHTLAMLGEAIEILPANAPDLSRNGLLWKTAAHSDKLLDAIRSAATIDDRIIVSAKELSEALKQQLRSIKKELNLSDIEVLTGTKLEKI